MSFKLFTPIQVGSIGRFDHRIVLAPLTRNRATPDTLCPTDHVVQYYRQRASSSSSALLLITEATHISPESLAYHNTPGIWSREQVTAWKKVTSAVKEQQEGARIVCQLWHTGRVAHPSFARHPAVQEYNKSNNDTSTITPCVSASPHPVCDANRNNKVLKTQSYDQGVQEHAVPRVLDPSDIKRICHDYKRAAINAQEAGFDGVEIHAAHGYLIDQFLNNGTNTRTDEYGGSCVENRTRFLQQVLESVLSVLPPGRVGVRLSPHDSPNGGNVYYCTRDSNPVEIYSHAIKMLNEYNLAYLLLTEPRWVGKYDQTPEDDPGFHMPLLNLQRYRHLYKGILIGAGGFTPRTMCKAVEGNSGYDMLAFGRWFISNPDLPLRLKRYLEYQADPLLTAAAPPPPLNRYEREFFYTHGPKGYIDYPSLAFEEYCREHHHQNAGAEEIQDANLPKEFHGMVLGRYAKVEQQDIGRSLISIHTSKL